MHQLIAFSDCLSGEIRVLDALIRSMPGTEDSREVVSLLNDRVEQLKMFKSWVDELIRQQKAA